MALPVIKFDAFTVEDVIEALDNNGYVNVENREWDIARDGAFKYVGPHGDEHRFLVGNIKDYGQDSGFSYYVGNIY